MLSCPWRAEEMPLFEYPGSVCLVMRTDETGFVNIRQAHMDVRFPESIDNAVHSRQIEFFAGRLLAKIALEKLGSFQIDVPIGHHREPVWPPGYIGSISHSKNLVGILLLKKSNLLVGMDIQHRITTDQCDSLTDVLNNKELALLAQAGLDRVESFTLGFSVKETLFKAVFPKVKQYLDFKQSALLKFDSNQNCVTVKFHFDDVSHQYLVSVVDFGICFITYMISAVDL